MTTFASVLYLEALLTSRLVSPEASKTFLSLVKQARKQGSSWPRHSIHLSAPLSLLSRSLALLFYGSFSVQQCLCLCVVKKGLERHYTFFFFHDDEKKKIAQEIGKPGNRVIVCVSYIYEIIKRINKKHLPHIGEVCGCEFWFIRIG